MGSNKSIKVNAVLNIIKTCCSIIFPLITFPYAARVLGSQNYGKFSFSSSIVSYISLIAVFGIINYATREGARRKNSATDLETFINQIFTLNIFTTVISYVILAIMFLFWNKLSDYNSIIIVISISIIFNTIGIDWVNIVFEDYAYITKRYILCYIIQLVCLFVFVRKETDIIPYAFVTIISSIVANILNIFYIRHEFHIYPRIVLERGLFNHLKPLFIFFVSSIVSTIYLNSGITLLGILKNDHVVGIYTVSSRIYVTVRHLINAITAVIIPRVSVMLGENKIEAVNSLLSKAVGTVILITFPAIVGMIVLRVPIVHIIAGKGYSEAVQPLFILSFALALATLANIYINAVLVPFKEEKKMLYISAGSAVVNIVVNLLLIPKFSYNAAAVATLIAEAIVVFCGYYSSKDLIHVYLSRELILAGIGSIIVLMVSWTAIKTLDSYIIQLAVSMFFSGILYTLVLVYAKNNIIYETLRTIIKKVKR